MIARPIYLAGADCIDIGDNFRALACSKLEAVMEYEGIKFYPKLKIGNNVTLNLDCHIACINEILIGNNVLIAGKVFITDHFHGLIDLKSLATIPSQRLLYSKGRVVIENNVWIGEGTVIMPNVTIGESSIVGANSVVTKSFPKHSVIAGVPARLIRTISL